MDLKLLKFNEMNRHRLLLILNILLLTASGCFHPLQITNLDLYNEPAPAPPKDRVSIGVVSENIGHRDNSRYVDSIVKAIQNQAGGKIEKVIYPYPGTSRQSSDVDLLLTLDVQPKYSGKGSNFLVNWPGFLIFAPALVGYGYEADITTVINIRNLRSGQSRQLTIPTRFTFREAEMDRSWTEISWLEVGIIALIGGIYFTQYDPDVTEKFISLVSPTYGKFVANKILESFPEVSALARIPS